MKKYIIIALCMMNSLNGMEQQNAENLTIQAYYKYDTLFTPGFLHFLHRNDISINDRPILSAQCSTGVLSAKLAETAPRVYGFDTHENIINFACDKYKDIKNLSFEHYHGKDLTTRRIFQLAVIDYTFFDPYSDIIENKKQMFQCINDNLSTDGEIFATFLTRDNRLHPKIINALDMIPDILEVTHDSGEEDITGLIIPPYPSLKELNTLLHETGFEIIKSEEQSMSLTIPEEDLWNIYSSAVPQNPIFAFIPDESKERLIQQYIENYLSDLDRTENGELLEPIIATIIHARKVEK